MPDNDSLEQALAGGAPQPRGLVPTTELVLSHKHPDDYLQVAATLDDIRRTHRTFSTRHRIIDTRSVVHDVVVIGDRMFDDDGEVLAPRASTST